MRKYRFVISGSLGSAAGAALAAALLAPAMLAAATDGSATGPRVAVASPTPTATCPPLPCPFGRVPYCPTAGEAVCVTPTPTRSRCPGDCSHDGRVTIDELVRGVLLALLPHIEGAPTCAELDMDGDGLVSINEIVAAVAAALNGCPTAGRAWQPIGPALRPVNAIAIDPTDSQVVYVGTPDGVFKTEDGGSEWTPTGLALLAGTIAVDPHMPSTVYVSGYDGTSSAVAKSTDGGQSWNEADAGLDPGVLGLAIDPRTADVLYAVGGSLYRSTDGARSWTPFDGGDGQTIEVFSFSPATPARLYLGRYRDGVSVIPVDEHAAVASAPAFVGNGYCALFSGGAGDIICAIAAAPSQSAVAYAHENYGSTCKTTDGGVTWTEISPIDCPPLDIDPECVQPPYIDVGCAQLVVDPGDPDTLYAATNPVLATTDGGITFHRVGRGLPADLHVHTIVLDPSQPSVAYVGTDQGIYRLADRSD